MAGEDDKTKGKLKEAGGALTGNRELKNEGKADQGKGKVKDAVESVKNTAAGAVDAVKDVGKDRKRT